MEGRYIALGDGWEIACGADGLAWGDETEWGQGRQGLEREAIMWGAVLVRGGSVGADRG